MTTLALQLRTIESALEAARSDVDRQEADAAGGPGRKLLAP